MNDAAASTAPADEVAQQAIGTDGALERLGNDAAMTPTVDLLGDDAQQTPQDGLPNRHADSPSIRPDR